ncbi:VRR-NUC domain-containing protein [Entomomonas moraniae]|uniref:VRR-NUC domain-containing protein n=1 Tax=Entomomonas moraniae TaxID=2213226 RepID=A0A3Q9JJ70_9GAMM|nr:VRR-NUC domain-containing protein [Entomomonas moraniae]
MVREHDEQVALINWFATQFPKYATRLVATPNAAKRSLKLAAMMKAEGMRKGFPDLNLPVARKGFHGLYIELKRTKGGKLSDEQGEWLDFLSSEGYKAVCAKGWDEARAVIIDYMRG